MIRKRSERRPAREVEGRRGGGLGAALRLRCPACGKAPMFASWTRMHERCRVCAYRFEREEGYWLGAMYVNYIVTGFFGLSVHIGLGELFDVSIPHQILIILPVMVTTPMLLFRHARSLWATLDLVFDPPRPADRPGGDAAGEAPGDGP